MVDTSKTLEVKGSPAKMAWLTILGILMTAVSGWLAIGDVGGSKHGIPASVFGWIGLVFFGACTALIFKYLLTLKGPVLVLSPAGLRDVRVAAETIPWSAVQRIGTWSHSGQSVMVLAVDPAVEDTLTLTRMARLSRGPNRALGADGLCISAQGLELPFDDVRAAASAYAQRWGASST